MLGLDAYTTIEVCAVLWGGMLVFMIARLSDRRYGTVGAPLSFIAVFTTIHCGALVHLVDGYNPQNDPYLASLHFTTDTVALGLEASTLAMASAICGFWLAERVVAARSAASRRVATSLESLSSAALIVLFVGTSGIVLEKGLLSYVGQVPGLQAVTANARNLFTIGGCLLIWQRMVSGRSRSALVLTGLFSVGMPLLYLLTTAILADSLSVGMSAFAFYLAMQSSRRARPFVLNLSLFVAVCLSGYVFSVAWLNLREGFRQVVWGGASIADVARTAADLVSNYDVATETDFKSLYALDSRLDQNLFVGLAIERLSTAPEGFANGETIQLALLGWVPRFLWPDKPVRGGAFLITKYTGKQTDGSTSFGAGPIFEFYINYAYYGIVIGFVLFGFTLRIIDINGFKYLSSGHYGLYLRNHLMGFALLQPGSDLFFVVTSFASAYIVGQAICIMGFTDGRIQMSRG
jgi:hypothetical protein